METKQKNLILVQFKIYYLTIRKNIKDKTRFHSNQLKFTNQNLQHSRFLIPLRFKLFFFSPTYKFSNDNHKFKLINSSNSYSTMSIDYRAFNVNITCAEAIKEGLSFVNFFRKSKVYAVVSVTGASSPAASQETPLAKYFGENPVWDCTMRFYLEESKLRENALILRIQLRQKGIFGKDEELAEALIPLKKLFDGNENLMDENYGSSSFLSPSGSRRAMVYYSYYFSRTYSVTSGHAVVAPPSAWEHGSTSNLNT